MARKAREGTVTPRKVARQVRTERENETTQPRRAVTKECFWRASAAQLRAIAATMRSGGAPERAEYAAQLEARADTLQGTRPRQKAVQLYHVVGPDWRLLLPREQAAEQLGVTEGSFSVMLSRHGGRWETVRPDGRGGFEKVVISGSLQRKTKPVVSPE